MLFTKPSLIPPSIHAAGIDQRDVAKWNHAIKKRMSGREAESKQPRSTKCFGWTDTRGDMNAVCFAPDIMEARKYVVRHAFVHLCEVEAAERAAMGRSVPKHGAALREYYRRLEFRAIAFAKECQLHELTQEEWERVREVLA